MGTVKIINGSAIKNLPWEDKPQGCQTPLWRYSKNPVTDWNPRPGIARIYNSSLLPYEDGFVGAFRCDYTDGNPHLHYGFSKDGLTWDFSENDIKWYDEAGELYMPEYCYDPRLVKIEDTYYFVWCTDFSGAALGIGSTKDFKSFTRHENPFVPNNRNGILFPRKLDGLFTMLSRPCDDGHSTHGEIFLSQSRDLTFWGKHRKVMSKGSAWWQDGKIGGGSVPIETSEGWLIFYHGVGLSCNGLIYSIGAAILDIDQPAKVLYRAADYLLTPEKLYETIGYVPNVCFPCAALADSESGRIAIYYGAADTHTAIAFCTIDEIVDHIKKTSKLEPQDDIAGR